MRRTPHLTALVGVLAAAALAGNGCSNNGDFLTDDRLANGLVIVLPGIEGQSELNENIRRGLVAGGVYQALPIHSWGRPIPVAGVLLNQVDFLGNRLAGVSIANMIVNYQDSHPGRPVHIVGHSGGGGVAVFAAEAMPKDRKIDGLVLLSASISSAYNLKKALSRCRKGIVNFYNPDDAGLLGIGTTFMGTVDGTHGPSAGLIGFDHAGKEGHERAYQVRVHASGDDPHSSTTHVGFVSLNVVPWVLSGGWPASPGFAHRSATPSTPAVEDPNEPAESKGGEKPIAKGKSPKPDKKAPDKKQVAAVEKDDKAPPKPKDPKKQKPEKAKSTKPSEDDGKD